MNFEHTEDRRMLSDMLRRFVAEQYDRHAPPQRRRRARP